MSDKNKIAKTIDARNKRASFEFFFLEEFTAGIVLTGTEIKSIRMSQFNMQDAFCSFKDGELFITNFHVSPYEKGTHYNHPPLRERKLLLKKRELKRLSTKLKDQGLTIVPTRLYINDQGRAKFEIALAKGKKLYDKRESIKERDVQRDTERY